MNYNLVWQPNTSLKWLQALSLPTKPWVKSFLELMGFPLELVSKLNVLSAIHTNAINKRDELWAANKELGYYPELDSAITREFMTDALKKIEEEVGFQATQAFQSWAYQSLVCEELLSSLLAWRVVLRHACGQGRAIYKLLPPPDHLLPLLPQVFHWVDYDRDRELHNKLLQVSPSYNDKDDLMLDISPEAMIVEEIIRSQLTREALFLIKNTLKKHEIEQVIKWAKAQAVVQQIPDTLLEYVFSEKL